MTKDTLSYQTISGPPVVIRYPRTKAAGLHTSCRQHKQAGSTILQAYKSMCLRWKNCRKETGADSGSFFMAPTKPARSKTIDKPLGDDLRHDLGRGAGELNHKQERTARSLERPLSPPFPNQTFSVSSLVPEAPCIDRFLM